jgi:K+-transporting ATPase ATPase A chain
MGIMFLAGLVVIYAGEAHSSLAPALPGLDQAFGNIEGKEVRFGIGQSSLFATVTTASSGGAVNSMHDSFMPLSGLVLMANMMLDEALSAAPAPGFSGSCCSRSSPSLRRA